MDREMAKVIAQDDDLLAKVSAYREVSKVRGRINEKLSGTLDVRWIQDDDEPTDKKKKPGLKATVEIKKTNSKEVAPGLEWQE
jgi:hypothetical protein